MKFRKTVKYVLYNLLVVGIALILMEILVRFFLPQIQPQGTDRFILNETEYGNPVGLKPNSTGISNGKLVEVDKYGFRSTSVTIDTSKICWLFLGDSVTMGIGVDGDSTFAGILQNKFENINILNPSVIGWSVNEYLTAAKFFIVENRYNFKLSEVVLFYCLNDLYTGDLALEMPGGDIRTIFGDALRFLRMNSRLYIFIKNVFSDRSKAYFEYDNQFYNNTNELLTNAVKKINDINSVCADKGIKFIVVILPYEFQLRKECLLTPHKFISDKLNSLRIKNYSAIDFFKKELPSREYYLYADGIHFSGKGHRVLADSLERILNIYP
jgi:lysophospholipase L1-like esterase